MAVMMIYTDYIDTPLGLFEFKASEQGITQAIFCGDKLNNTQQESVIKTKAQSNTITNEITDRCKLQLQEYFNGTRQAFDLPLAPRGTEFQQTVWACLNTLKFGEYCSYKYIAKMIGKPKASQAVGGANGRNPLTLIVPCHRVIGTNGSLTGYAGGIERKLWLLAHEGISLPANSKDKHRDIRDVISTKQVKTEFLD